MVVLYPSCLWSAVAVSLIFWKVSHETGAAGWWELAEIILKLKPAWCTLAEEAPGSVIISQLNLVCVCHDSLQVCMLCHVAYSRSGFKGGHRSGQGRLKQELPVLLTGRLCTERERQREWIYGALEFGLCTTQLELQDKSQKQERK